MNLGMLPFYSAEMGEEFKPLLSRWPVALLVKPLENILIADARLGLPSASLAALGAAGIVSVARLVERMAEPGGLARIPRIGKQTAAEIGDVVRAFLEARDEHELRG